MMRRSKQRKMGMVGCIFKPEFAMLRLVTDFWSSESGATAIEYGLIVVGISMTIIAAVNSVGNSLKADLAASAAGINP
jgi:pilus assembly protein Flp/PilA